MNNEDRLISLIKSFNTAMLVTQHGVDELTSRPMAIAQVDDDGQLWFVTNRKSGKISEIQDNPNVLITFQSEKQYVSLSGNARVVDDRAKIKSLWSSYWRIWFPGGKDDPDIVLVHFCPAGGEYWDQGGLDGVKYIANVGMALLQGETPKSDESVNAKVSLDD